MTWANCTAPPSASFVVTLIASSAHADGPDISAQRLVSAWKGDVLIMRMVADVMYGRPPFRKGFWRAWATGLERSCIRPFERGA